MGKRQKYQKKSAEIPKKSKFKQNEDVDFSDMDDEIDQVYKKRDVIPLDINADNDDSEDDDDELPVFDYKGINGDDDDDEDEDDEEEYDDRGLAAKIVRQQKYLREKTGGIDDESLDDSDEDEKERSVWSRGKRIYYGSDEDFELRSSDEEALAEEEEEVIRLQKQRAQNLRPEDFDIPTHEYDSDEEPTLEERRVKDKVTEGDAVSMYEEVKKDLNALSRDEQMDIVSSAAPELVGLHAELNDAYNQLVSQVNPLLDKVRKGKNAKKEGMHYFEVKQSLLLAYCQAIVFYLLLRSEGQSVRDHPVVARLVEIKTLLDKMKEFDRLIPDDLDDILNEKSDTAAAQSPVAKHAASASDLYAELNHLTGSSAEKQDAFELRETAESVTKVDEKKRKRQDQPISSESMKMLEYRAALEEKLTLKSMSGYDASKIDKSKKQKLKSVSGKLETTDDFDDDALELEGTKPNNGHASTLSSKVSSIIPSKNKKTISGDDDLPERDDLGERRWKHQLRVLANAGIKLNNNDIQPESGRDALADHSDDVEDNEESDGSDSDLYETVKRQRDEKLKLKAEKYSRQPREEYEPDTTVDGKRNITRQMEKNRGLTRTRKKQFKNPRKKHRIKADQAMKRRKGQVREVKKPIGPYGGESTGINARVSRSIKFKG